MSNVDLFYISFASLGPEGVVLVLVLKKVVLVSRELVLVFALLVLTTTLNIAHCMLTYMYININCTLTLA